jgi:hypothetical protein
VGLRWSGSSSFTRRDGAGDESPNCIAGDQFACDVVTLKMRDVVNLDLGLRLPPTNKRLRLPNDASRDIWCGSALTHHHRDRQRDQGKVLGWNMAALCGAELKYCSAEFIL